MTLKECYIMMGGDYDGVVSRFRNEALVQKFALKFLDDTSYGLLQSSLQAGDNQEAFRAAHTIKGICQNLGFSRLLQSSSDLSEALRAGQNGNLTVLIGRVEEDYRQTIAAIRQLQEGLNS